MFENLKQKMTPEEAKVFDFELNAGMRDRKTGSLYPRFEVKKEVKKTKAKKSK